MDSDSKVFLWVMLLLIGLPMFGMALTDYQKSQCKMAGIAAHMSAEEIEKVCK